jgi:hypothetical protein
LDKPTMKKLILILALALAPTSAFAQCNGAFGANRACGSIAGGAPGPIPFSAINTISSVANSDGTLTISPTTGAVVASINLTNPNNWLAAQTIDVGSGINQPGNSANNALSLFGVDGAVFHMGGTGFGHAFVYLGSMAAGTRLAPTPPTNNTTITEYAARAYDTTWLAPSMSAVQHIADGDWSLHSHPVRICLATNTAATDAQPNDTFCVKGDGTTVINQNVLQTATAPGLGVLLVGADGVNAGFNRQVYGALAQDIFDRADGTAAAQTALLIGEEIGRVSFGGHNGTAVVGNKGRFNCFAAENWTLTANGIYCSIYLTPKTTATSVETIRFQASGGLSVGNANVGTDGGAGVVVATQYNIGASQIACGNIANAGTACSANVGTLGPVVPAWSATAPVIASGFCSTGTPTTISASNGTAAFDILIGAATCGSTGTLTLPAATTGWVCNAADVTTLTHRIAQTGTQGSTTSVVLTDYSITAGTAQNFNPSDHIHVSCVAY